MEQIKTILAKWSSKKEDFNPKLVAREETGCCESEYDPKGNVYSAADGSMEGMSDGPCAE